jgi:hypothetical protein
MVGRGRGELHTRFSPKGTDPPFSSSQAGVRADRASRPDGRLPSSRTDRVPAVSRAVCSSIDDYLVDGVPPVDNSWAGMPRPGMIETSLPTPRDDAQAYEDFGFRTGMWLVGRVRTAVFTSEEPRRNMRAAMGPGLRWEALWPQTESDGWPVQLGAVERGHVGAWPGHMLSGGRYLPGGLEFPVVSRP